MKFFNVPYTGQLTEDPHASYASSLDFSFHILLLTAKLYYHV